MRIVETQVMYTKVIAGCLVGVEAERVDVEVHLVKGLPGFELVGLPELSVKESRVRVRAALSNSGLKLPPRRIVINLAPAGLRKRGACFDLAIAVALVHASGHCPGDCLEETLFFGELSLSGDLRPNTGLVAQLCQAQRWGLSRAIVPAAQLSEAVSVTGIEVLGARDLSSVIDYLAGRVELPRAPDAPLGERERQTCDLDQVRGQLVGKRALEIAAAGNHHLLFVGPPGAGKTMLARRLSGLLPHPDVEEAQVIARIASAAGLRVNEGGEWRPFRAPHHSASAAALVGGGDPIRPGEVTLAHGGVLFLDELPEFGRVCIDSLRTTMESGEAVVVRVRDRVIMPAAPLVVAAMNPCPCGFDGDPIRLCTCTHGRAQAYRGRVSGPILDRFDLHVSLSSVRLESLGKVSEDKLESSRVVRERVIKARYLLNERRAESGENRPHLTDMLTLLSERSNAFALKVAGAMSLSMRGLERGLWVADTIAALEGETVTSPDHLAEAFSYRQLSRATPTSGRGAGYGS